MDITASQAETVAGWIKDDLAKGKITPKQKNKAYDQLGASPEQHAPDTRSAEVKALNQHFPPAKPEDFLISYGVPGHPPRR